MNLNTSNLSHPRTAWSVEAAMWRAIEESRECSLGVGIKGVHSASGKTLFSVITTVTIRQGFHSGARAWTLQLR